MTNENLLYSTGNSTRCSVMTEMGRKSKKDGIYVYIWLIHFAAQQKLTQQCKATTLQFKKNEISTPKKFFLIKKF